MRARPTSRSAWILVISMSRFARSEEHTSELQSRLHLVCRLLLEKKNNTFYQRRGFNDVNAAAKDNASGQRCPELLTTLHTPARTRRYEKRGRCGLHPMLSFAGGWHG